MALRLHQIGFFVYWLVFVGYAVRQGEFPGYSLHQGPWEYPYTQVTAVCLLLALFLSVIYFILYRARFPYLCRRLLAALVYSAVLLLVCSASVVTDLPGYYYVPAMFSLVTLGALLVLALVSAVRALAGRSKRAA